MTDLLLRGCVLPGRPRLVDISIANGRITELLTHEPGVRAPANERIDVGGRVVTPGLVEAHIHLDKALLSERMATGAESALDAIRMVAEAKKKGVKLLLPLDHVVADKFEASAKPQNIGAGQAIPDSMMGLDIGPESVEQFAEEISRAATIVWNGPMGVFEMPAFSKGTFKIARAVADNPGATSIVGGGDSVSAVKAAGVADKISHISTGGGASLEFLEGKKLPGVEALTDKR